MNKELLLQSMSNFDQLFEQFLERLTAPSYVKNGVPHSYEWVPEPPPQEETDQFNWKGVSPDRWKGLAVVNKVFDANNAGPFKLTTSWLQDYRKLSPQEQDTVNKKFKKLLAGPSRQVNIEIKTSKAHAGVGSVIVWQIAHDMYNIFRLSGNERSVEFLRLFKDHDEYRHWILHFQG